MFLRILKKDLQRRKTTNAILLVFIMLASIFVSSSVNNVAAVLNGIDYFWEKSNMPELLALSVGDFSVEDVLDGVDSIDHYDAVPMRFLDPDQLTYDGETVEDSSLYMIPYIEQTFLYFDENNEPIRKVTPGTVWISASSMSEAGLKAGDIMEIHLQSAVRELTVAGSLKDAACLGRLYLMNSEDYDAWFSESDVLSGAAFYIYTDDSSETMQRLKAVTDTHLMVYKKETMRLSFLPYMILAGILLAVSICLILIAFVVLRFTIAFTLQEEFRQIGVMKAIGLSNFKIRSQYLGKYLLLSAVGAFIGFFGSIPFSNLLLDSVSETMVLGNDSSMLINALCCAAVVAVTLAFCYSCTAKVKKFTPVDAIRNGTTGERFRKKGLLRLSKTPGKPSVFLALNDVLSHPRRFFTIILTMFLCLSLVLMLTTSINTLKSEGLLPAFNIAPFDLICSGGYTTTFVPEGNQLIREDLEETEALLNDSGLDCRCYAEVALSFSLFHGENQYTSFVSQGIGTTTDQYTYFEGTAPSAPGEIAVTPQAAKGLDAQIGDTITMQIGTESREFIITGYFQTMMNQGQFVRVHQDEPISYEHLIASWGMQIGFMDDPSAQEIQNRIVRIKELLHVDEVLTASEYAEDMTGMAETLESVRLLILIISLIITILITVLIGHSFVAKERGDIAILKAIGFQNAQILAWQSLRFVICCILSTGLALVLHMPLMKLAINPIFTMMGAEFGIQYEILPLETYCIYPGIFLAVTSISAFLTAQHTRTVQTNECSNID